MRYLHLVYEFKFKIYCLFMLLGFIINYIFEVLASLVPGYKTSKRLQKKILKRIEKLKKADYANPIPGNWRQCAAGTNAAKSYFISIPLEKDVNCYADNVMQKMTHFRENYQNSNWVDEYSYGSGSVGDVLFEIESLIDIWGLGG